MTAVAEFITVDAHDVEHGDTIAGIANPRPVEHIEYRLGRWWYFSADNQLIHNKPHWARVQVVRGTPVSPYRFHGDPADEYADTSRPA